MSDYPFGVFTPIHLEKMREGVDYFNQQKYWECHEALEHVWMEDSHDPARNVYWGVIQVAAAMIHYRDQKIVGARGLIKKAKEKFKRAEDLKVETNLLYDYLSWEKLKNLVYEIPDEPELKDFKKLFEFRFEDYKKAPVIKLIKEHHE